MATWKYRSRHIPALRVSTVAAGVLISLGGCAAGGSPSPTLSVSPVPPPTAQSSESVSTTSDSPTTQPTTAGQPAAAVLYGCDMQPVTKPTEFTLLCGDGGAWLQNLTWTGWGLPVASATGELLENDCSPDCAEGTAVPYPATVTLTNLNNGIYTAMNISAPQEPDGGGEFRVDQSGPVTASVPH